VRTMPDYLRTPGRQPKIITMSSTGITNASHKMLPLPHRIGYPWLLSGPHADKAAMERVSAHLCGRQWVDPEPSPTLLKENWKDVAGTPAYGALPDIVVLRPAWLTDGECRGTYRVGEGGKGYYTVSRKDVAHFIVEGILKDWPRWKGQCVAMGY
jgi:hypothetical protein